MRVDSVLAVLRTVTFVLRLVLVKSVILVLQQTMKENVKLASIIVTFVLPIQPALSAISVTL